MQMYSPEPVPFRVFAAAFLRALVLLLVLSGFEARGWAQSAPTGVIVGRVFNPTTGQYVRNAQVAIQGTNLRTTTGPDGFYRLGNVPAGEAQVVVSFTGYEPAPATVAVVAGQTTTRDFELTPSGLTAAGADGDTVLLQSFVVSSEREGNAKAIMDQKAALNVKSVVASDSFGNIAEGNIGEFLKFMPGITLSYVETDTRAARMGGMAARYGAVTLDGNAVANTSSGSFGDSSRQFEFEAMSINNIESIEVNKTLSADMLGDAPAGTVNLVSRSALDRRGRTLNWSASVIGNQYEHSLSKTPRHDDTKHAKTRPSFTFDFSDSFLDSKLGITVNAAHTSVFKEQFRNNLTYDYNSAQAQAAGRPLVTVINFKDGPKMTDKYSGGLKIDYQALPDLRVSLTTSYTWFSDEIANRNFAFRVNAAQVDPSSTLTRVVANPSPGSINTRVGHEGSHGNKKKDTTNVALGFVWKRQGLTVDGQASYSRAREQNGSDHMRAVATANANLTGIGWIAERPDVGSAAWQLTQTSGPSWYDVGNYNANAVLASNISNSRVRSETLQLVGQLNAKKEMNWRLPTTIKSGLYVQESLRDRDQFLAETLTYVGPGGVQTSPLSRMPASIAEFRTDVWGTNLRPLQVPDKSHLYHLLQAHPEYFTQTEAQQANDLNNILGSKQYAKEQIDAAYVMGTTRVDDWQFQAGIRYEGTRTAVDVLERIPDAQNPFPSNTIRGILHRWSLGKQRNYGEYDDLLASGSARWEITRDLILKMGYHQAIKRPQLNHLGGTWNINEGNFQITIPNAELKPERSDKYSVMLEYYFEPAGQLSAHVFQSSIEDLTQSTGFRPASEFGYGDDPIYSTYEFRTFENIPGTTKLKGVELSYNQRFTFLPGLLKGLSAFATYSWYDYSPITPVDIPLRAATGGIGYRYSRFDFSLNGTWTDDTKIANPLTTVLHNGDIEYNKARTIFDVNVGYKLTDRLSLFIAGRNAFNSGKVWYFKDSDGRMRQIEKYGGQWTLGVSGEF